MLLLPFLLRCWPLESVQCPRSSSFTPAPAIRFDPRPTSTSSSASTSSSSSSSHGLTCYALAAAGLGVLAVGVEVACGTWLITSMTQCLGLQLQMAKWWEDVGNQVDECLQLVVSCVRCFYYDVCSVSEYTWRSLVSCVLSH